MKDKILQYEYIHFSGQKAANRVARGVNDGLAADVETCVDENSAARCFFEAFYQSVIPSVAFGIERLYTRRKVDMRYGRKFGAPDVYAFS